MITNKNSHKLFFHQDANTKVNGFMEKDKAKAYKLSQTIVSMMVSGDIIRSMVKGKLYMQMGMYIKENGLMIKQTDLAFIFITMVPYTKVIGSIIFKMELELNFGLMVVNTRDNINKGKSMEKVYIYGLTRVILKVTGIKIK